ncbi:MAG: hypothetical protein O2966_06365 [Proteobacteria bacterium]|nr:hypothetical protein [Pseudomonadota bacterium]
MVLQALNLGILTLLFFVVGMYKPKWALFFMEKPSRWLISSIAMICFMITMTMYGQGIKKAQIIENHKKPAAAMTAPVPVPEAIPVPIPEAPKVAPKKNSPVQK